MKFSLKTMLIVVCAVGAVSGIMWKLFTESPETFIQVLSIGSTAGPFLLAIGTIFWLALSGKPFRTPDTATDVRNRRWRLALWGLILLLTPVAGRLTLALLLPSGDPLQLLGTYRLIHNRLPNQAGQPWVWNELENRLNKRSLTKAEVEEAVQELVSYMKKTRPTGWNQPLSWQKEFVDTANKAKMISDEVLFDLCDAFYGPQPIAQPITQTSLPVGKGTTALHFGIEYGNPWSDDSGMGIEMLWDVKQVLLDGAPSTLRQAARFAEQWSSNCDGNFAPGDHEIKIEVECAYVDSNKLIASPRLTPLPISQWPTARKRWTTTISLPLKIEEANTNKTP